jgi:DNA-binding beta-propeller fold protein YncE
MTMNRVNPDSSCGNRAAVALLVLLTLVVAWPAHLEAKKKQEPAQAAAPTGPRYDLSKIDTAKLVWPEPPLIPRIQWLNYFTGMKIDYSQAEVKKVKQGWMDRLAGTQQQDAQDKLKSYPWQFIQPYCIAVDSKGKVYVGDQRVGAIFIFDVETGAVELIKNGYEAKFALINGLAMDDGDRLFVADGKMRRVYVFNKDRKVENVVMEGLEDPNGIALDVENRFLYVADTQQDIVQVYDADSLKLLRHLGVPGKNHASTEAGEFSKPVGVAVDSDGNVYVTDMMNNRVEIFDADGKFISQFGKHCDVSGCFARPKGIAIDSDNHVWVVDNMLDAVQAFDREGNLAGFVGGHGNGPGAFASAAGIAIDKQNRIFVTDQYPGRMQMFRYVTDAEAAAEKKSREEKSKQKSAGKTEQKSALVTQEATRGPAAH